MKSTQTQSSSEFPSTEDADQGQQLLGDRLSVPSSTMSNDHHRLRSYHCLSRTSSNRPHPGTHPTLTAALVLCLFAIHGHSSGYDPYSSYKNGRSYGNYGYDQSYHSPPQQSYGQYNIHDYQSPTYQSSYTPYRKYYKHYLPGPQFCPETGRTVCSKVAPFYPTDEVFSVVKMARAKRFNISSEFIDESENDSEPHFHEEDPWPEPEPFLNVNVPPPGPHQLGGGGHFGGNGGSFGHHGFAGQQPIHFHNIDYKPYYPRPEYRATVPPPFHQKSIYASSYSGPHSGYASSYASAAASVHSRYKRQASGNAVELPIEPVCPSRVILIEPKAALNDKRQWKFVVNLSERDPRLKQAIKVEVCTTPNQPCSNQISLPFGFISRCKQKYIKKKLISLDPSGQSISSENFFAPSCCVCEVIRNVGGNSGDNAAAASTTNEQQKKRKKK